MKKMAYWDILYLEDIRRNVSCTEGFADSVFDALDQWFAESVTGSHLDEEQDALVLILGTSLSYTECVIDFLFELVQCRVDLC